MLLTFYHLGCISHLSLSLSSRLASPRSLDFRNTWCYRKNNTFCMLLYCLSPWLHLSPLPLGATEKIVFLSLCLSLWLPSRISFCLYVLSLWQYISSLSLLQPCLASLALLSQHHSFSLSSHQLSISRYLSLSFSLSLFSNGTPLSLSHMTCDEL